MPKTLKEIVCGSIILEALKNYTTQYGCMKGSSLIDVLSDEYGEKNEAVGIKEMISLSQYIAKSILDCEMVEIKIRGDQPRFLNEIAGMVKDANAGFCPFCKKDMTDAKFRDELSLKEFNVSGLCQKCQDNFFGK